MDNYKYTPSTLDVESIERDLRSDKPVKSYRSHAYDLIKTVRMLRSLVEFAYQEGWQDAESDENYGCGAGWECSETKKHMELV